jgi:hypothetical protein
LAWLPAGLCLPCPETRAARWWVPALASRYLESQ